VFLTGDVITVRAIRGRDALLPEAAPHVFVARVAREVTSRRSDYMVISIVHSFNRNGAPFLRTAPGGRQRSKNIVL